MQSVSIFEADGQEPISWRRFPFNVPAIKKMGQLSCIPALRSWQARTGLASQL